MPGILAVRSIDLPSVAALVAAAAAAVATPHAAAQCQEGCTALLTLTGEAPGDQFGWVSNDLGDVDGDGVHDFVITAPTNDGGGTNAGRIYVYSGATGLELWRRTGAPAGALYGHDANEAGDIDGLGSMDVIVGAPGAGAGRAFVLSSEDDGAVIKAFNGASPGDEFGYRVHGGGDYDGDGTPDVVIGARGADFNGFNAGAAYVYSGADFELIDRIDGFAAGDRFGSGVTFCGDVDGDGRDDIAVGAMNDGPTSGGRAYVYRWDGAASVLVHTLVPPGPSANMGQWFMNGGFDVDADGVPDVYVNDFAANRAHVFSGADGSTIHELNGNGEGGGFGIGRIVPDIDGDGHADLILAAWASGQGAPGAGKVFIYGGADGAVLETYTHAIAGAGFGFDANGMGDVDGDGRTDWLITAASDLASRGRVYLIAGGVGPPGPDPDLDGDGVVSFGDLVTLLASWGPCPPPPADCPADLDGDGSIGFGDVVALLAAWD